MEASVTKLHVASKRMAAALVSRIAQVTPWLSTRDARCVSVAYEYSVPNQHAVAHKHAVAYEDSIAYQHAVSYQHSVC